MKNIHKGTKSLAREKLQCYPGSMNIEDISCGKQEHSTYRRQISYQKVILKDLMIGR